MAAAGFTDQETEAIRQEIAHYVDVRAEVKLGAGEDVDFKQYEAGMRFLLDTYIQASPSTTLTDFEDQGLIQLIVQLGVGAIDKLPEGIRRDKAAVAETITNNIRKVIIDEHALNPKYYDRMSQLLDAIIEARRQEAIDYEEYLVQLIEQARKIGVKESDTKYPDWADTGARRALADFELPSDDIAIAVDQAIMQNKPDNWVGNIMKERRVKLAISKVLPPGYDRLDELFNLVKARHEYR